MILNKHCHEISVFQAKKNFFSSSRKSVGRRKLLKTRFRSDVCGIGNRRTNIQGVKFKIKAIILYFCVLIQTINCVEIFHNLLYFTMNYYWYVCLLIRQTWYTKLYVLMLTSTMTMYTTLVSILSKKNRQAITLVSHEQIHTSSMLLCLLIHVYV